MLAVAYSETKHCEMGHGLGCIRMMARRASHKTPMGITPSGVIKEY